MVKAIALAVTIVAIGYIVWVSIKYPHEDHNPWDGT